MTPPPADRAPPAPLLELVACAAYLFGTTPRDILQPSKHGHIVPARWAVWWTLRSHGSTFPRIGRRFGKDHTTVLHGVRKAGERIATDPDYAAKVSRLVQLRDGEFLQMQRDGACKHHIPMLPRTLSFSKQEDPTRWE